MCTLKKEEKLKINGLRIHSKKWLKAQQIKSQENRRKGIIVPDYVLCSN